MPINLILPLKKDILVDYLRFNFNAGRSGPIMIDRTEDLGKYILSMVRHAEFPVKQNIPDGYTPVEIQFNKGEFSTAHNHFNYRRLPDTD